MGDRTTVTLTVLKSQSKEAEKLFYGQWDEGFDIEQFTQYVFNDVNYGNLDELPSLQNMGIAYNSRWDAGSNYGPGEETCRFTPEGELLIQTIGDEYKNPCLKSLMEAINSHEMLKRIIMRHYEEVTALPWDNQEEYGKLFRARRLINPT